MSCDVIPFSDDPVAVST